MNKALKIACVFGTRPEAIKMMPIIKELSKNQNFKVINIVTAQHREMLDQVLKLFSIKPDFDLSIMEKDQTLAQIISNSIDPLDKLFSQICPDIVLVQGDTSTTFIASLASFYNRIPVGHIEAGLRTSDKFQPYPEEINRRLTSVIAELHFAPTELARDNLIAEGINPKKIFITGNTIVDAFRLALMTNKKTDNFKLPKELKHKRLIFVTAHRRENHGKAMKSICQALKEIVRNHDDIAIVFPVHYNPKVRDVVFPMLSRVERIFLTDPLDYIDTVHLIQNSTLVLTDSGGIQEEAPSDGKPVLVLRNKTERPEGIKAGTAMLVGTDKNKITQTVRMLLTSSRKYHNMAQAVNPYGDGKASTRIAQAILYSFGRSSRKPIPFIAS